MYLKFFDICLNNPGIWSHKFAGEVTKLWTPDEIRRFDGIHSPESSIIPEPLPVPFYTPFTEQSFQRIMESFSNSLFYNTFTHYSVSRTLKPFPVQNYTQCTLQSISSSILHSIHSPQCLHFSRIPEPFSSSVLHVLSPENLQKYWNLFQFNVTLHSLTRVSLEYLNLSIVQHYTPFTHQSFSRMLQ